MELKSVQFKADNVDLDQRIFSGYAATWDLDQGGDIIQSGAFSKTLNERAGRVKVLWQHNEPIGRPLSMREDAKGLFVEGRISKTRLGDEALELMKDGVVDQMSIGYIIPQGKSSVNGDGIRVITEVKLLEFSPVTFPMNEAAMITGVKNIQNRIKSGNLTAEELKNLSGMIGDLNALLTNEPLSTHEEKQPQDLTELKQAILNFKL